MTSMSPAGHDHSDAHQRSARPWMVACVMLAFILLFFMLREHWEHVAGKWPYMLLLACPLLHVFMHGKHGHAGQSHMPTTPSPASPHSGHK